MQLERRIAIDRDRDTVVELICSDDTLLTLLPGRTEILESRGDERTTRTHYSVMGREGDATFVWTYLMDGSLAFRKVCDGHVWRELIGSVTVDEEGGRSIVMIEMSGSTKSFVPEFTIKGPLEDQIAQMSDALREILAGA